MMQLTRGHQLVALTPENLCMDILSSLLNEVVTIATKKQLEKSPSVISDTDEEIFSPPKKNQRLTFNLPRNVCRKLFQENSPNETERHLAREIDKWTILVPKPDTPFAGNDERCVSISIPESSKNIITSEVGPTLINEPENVILNPEQKRNLEGPKNSTDIITSEEGSMQMCEPENVVINPEENENVGVSVEVDPLSISDLDQLLDSEQQKEHSEFNDVINIVQSQPDTQSIEKHTETSEN
ncbi:hypothetical protein O0L34_g7990 [Tuta absoluta]|nr:hypothetical protein O0L34_g7990 [Tuta absoluta]